MTVKIISDSGSDISQEYAEKLGVRIIPLSFSFGEKEYFDGIDLSNDEFYQKMKEEEELPKTSQITPYRYQQVFEEETRDDDSVRRDIDRKLCVLWMQQPHIHNDS